MAVTASPKDPAITNWNQSRFTSNSVVEKEDYRQRDHRGPRNDFSFGPPQLAASASALTECLRAVPAYADGGAWGALCSAWISRLISTVVKCPTCLPPFHTAQAKPTGWLSLGRAYRP
jgi:hypothetical protein